MRQFSIGIAEIEDEVERGRDGGSADHDRDHRNSAACEVNPKPQKVTAAQPARIHTKDM